MERKDNFSKKEMKTNTKKSVLILSSLVLTASLVGFTAPKPIYIVSPLPLAIASEVSTTDVRPTYTQDRIQEFKTFVKRIAGQRANLLISIASCEGLYHKTQVNNANRDGSEDRGPLQINSVHYQRIPGATIKEKKEWLMNPENNALFGYNLLLEQGTTPWSSSKLCWEGRVK